MVYQFLKKDGNCIGIGDIDIEQLSVKFNEYIDNGYEQTTLNEYVAQVVKAAASVPEEGAASEPAEVVAEVAPESAEPQA